MALGGFGQLLGRADRLDLLAQVGGLPLDVVELPLSVLQGGAAAPEGGWRSPIRLPDGWSESRGNHGYSRLIRLRRLRMVAPPSTDDQE